MMRFTTALSVFLFTAALASAQGQGTDSSSIHSVLNRMNSQTWSERSKAFEEAVTLQNSGRLTPDDADRMRLGLIQLLTLENTEMKAPHAGPHHATATSNGTDEGADQKEAEGHSEYYADLIGRTAELGDERAIPALLGAANTGGMATHGLAQFGKKALNPVLAQVENHDSSLAAGAVYVIRDMLKMQTVRDPDSQVRIKNALRSAIARPEFEVRLSAMAAIEFAPDREDFVPLLNDIAEHDPVKLAGQKPDDGGDNGEFYPARRNARRLLRQIANHEPVPNDQRPRQ